jgi:ATP/maltotriose-dependent transcriptional regulator MalT/DNA-binding SARP family transcriptional activator
LRSRLVPPSLPRDCLPRPELVRTVVDGLDGRLVSVVAGAGYGKTTLLAQGLGQSSRPWVWLSCDERMTSADSLLGHLAAGLGERFPGVATRLALEGAVETQVDDFCNEVSATVADDVVLVMDDVHTLGGEATAALGLLARNLPPTVHLLLAGRTALPFRLRRGPGRVREVGERALALSVEECAELLEGVAPAVPAAAVERLRAVSEGWVTGVLLAAGSGTVPEPSAAGDGSVFEYLADEVLAGQTPRVRDFLLTTAVMDRFTPELAGAVSGDPDPRSRIGELLSRHLFTVPLAGDGEWYRYHHLFAGFLRQRLRESTELSEGEVHARAGEAWLDAGEPAEAAAHLLRAGEPGRAADALDGVAEQLAITPEAAVLEGWLEEIPRDLWRLRPGLALAEASLRVGRGDYEGAVRELTRAVEALVATGDRGRAALALFRLMQALMAIGADPRSSIVVAERFLPGLDPDHAMTVAVRLMLSGFLAQAGRYEAAEAELRAVDGTPAAARHPSLAVCADANRANFIDHPLGRSAAALERLDEAVAWLDVHGSEDPLTYLVWAHAYRAVIFNHLGRWEDALVSADRWRDAWERRGGTRRAGERSASWVRFGALAALGRWTELERQLEACAGTAAEAPGTIYASRFNAGRALLAAHRGDRGSVAKVVAITPTAAAFARSMIQSDLALAAGQVGLGDAARALARDALDCARRVDAPWAAARAALVGASVWGPDREGDALLAEAIRLSDRPGLEELWTRRERQLAPALLARALAAGLGPGGVAARLALACGADAGADVGEALTRAPPAVRIEMAESLADAPAADAAIVRALLADREESVRKAVARARDRAALRPRAALRIVALGGFAVARGAMEVPQLSRGRNRARVLLAMLVAATAPIHREVLMERLWPHLPPARALAALHTTLHTVRRLLDPDHAGRKADHAVATDGQAYRLALDERDDLDTRALSRLVAEARSLPSGAGRTDRLLAAEGLRGAFLPEWPYEDWASERRAQVSRDQQWVLATLAEDLEAVGEPLAAAGRYSQLLEIEPEREAWHRALMRVYAAAGERGLALRQFHACRTVLRERLGSEPGDETRTLYASLL